jgi:hypothetical protein
MNKEAIYDQKVRVEGIFTRAAWAFGMDGWRIVIEAKETLPALSWGCSNPCLMCDCSWHYKMVEVKVSAVEVAKLADSQLYYHVAHELAHGLVNEMREWRNVSGNDTDQAMRHEERVVTELTPIFLSAFMRWIDQEK